MMGAAEILAISRNWGQHRTTSGDGKPIDGGRTHLARDIYIAPGSWVYAPFDGTFSRWSWSNSDGSPDMGRIAYVKDDSGRTWRFIHLAVKDWAGNLKPGDRVKAGTRLGRTSTHKLGSADSHLHLDVFPAGASTSNMDARVDPLPILGIDGFNKMIGGGGGTGLILFAAAAAGVWYWYSSKRTLRT